MRPSAQVALCGAVQRVTTSYQVVRVLAAGGRTCICAGILLRDIDPPVAGLTQGWLQVSWWGVVGRGILSVHIVLHDALATSWLQRRAFLPLGACAAPYRSFS